MESHDEHALIIYTDGSSKPKPRRGGAAFVLAWTGSDDHEQTYEEKVGGYTYATNNEMELVACIEALKFTQKPRCPVAPDEYRKIVFYCDSAYVVDHIKHAEIYWPRDGWIKRDGDPVDNPELWQRLVKEKSRSGRVDFRKVKAHSKNAFNKRADRLAREAADEAAGTLRGVPTVARKRSQEVTQPYSVPMQGQEEVIRIVSAEPLSGQPQHKYRYEVVDPESPNASAVDFAFAISKDISLRRGHSYRVRFSEPGEGRWIREMIEEVDRRFGLADAGADAADDGEVEEQSSPD